MGYGYFGKVLWIDLTNDSFKEEELFEKNYRQFMGGYGLGCKLLYERMSSHIEPLSPESFIGFFPGLLTSTAAPYSGRFMVVGKSPLTGTWGDANCGGNFGPAIKACGYDGIMVSGKSKEPKYLSIIDDDIKILDASNIWGKDIIETEKILKKKHGNSIKTAGIGKAGEMLSKISGIASDRGRIAARSGLGAIMGSKNLKTIVLKGNKKVEIFNREKFYDLIKEYNKTAKIKPLNSMKKSFLSRMFGMVKSMRRLKMGSIDAPNLMRTIYRNFGTSIGNTISAETGDSPIKNWSGIGMYDFPYNKSTNLSSINIGDYKIKEYGCFSCPVQCGAILNIPELNIEEMHIPEYETCCAFGSLLLNNDLLSIFQINDICNRAAIDTISTGATVAYAIECFENGLINTSDTKGLELNWGNSKAILQLVKKMILREDIGDLLADGVKIATEKIGKESELYAIHSLGSEIPMHDPRYFNSLAFSYAYDPTPGRHTTASIDFADIGPYDKFEKKLNLPKKRNQDDNRRVEAQVITTGFHQILDCAGMCMFSTSFGPYPFIDLINSLTGWNNTIDEYITTGLRIQTLRQAFTIREGIKIAQNKLPDRVTGNPPAKKGPLKGKTIEYKDFYRKFCIRMGWNPENGYPLERTLEKLNLEFVIKDLY
ncbi:MAG: aldehyde ferredoxin oxidoreductase family protein [Candidatus Lokiarchaeota archaeon]|nr:aldehyde ferredoxin oxidoreductase family protein [Candidatus Lokiarchaeota archaeon]